MEQLMHFFFLKNDISVESKLFSHTFTLSTSEHLKINEEYYFRRKINLGTNKAPNMTALRMRRPHLKYSKRSIMHPSLSNRYALL